MKTNWDYTDRAETYDLRPDYSEIALDKLLAAMGSKSGDAVVDIGAGTGKLTIPLIRRGLKVTAVEPNDAMRAHGIKNTLDLRIEWREGTAEATGLDDSSFSGALFGSSFNVTDNEKALLETARILFPGGWFSCMWNHRALEDPLQNEIEQIIRTNIPDYKYGERRNDPTPSIQASGLFDHVGHISETFHSKVKAADWVRAWESHATLANQAGDKFQNIISQIRQLIGDVDSLEIPYTTKIWYACLKSN